MAKKKQQQGGDILGRLRGHFDQGTCNEEPQMVIDHYERDRREAAREIADLRRRLAAVYALSSGNPELVHDDTIVHDDNVVPLPRT
jgi:hypothetical protein